MTEEYRAIPLTKGQEAVVDADNYEWLSRHKWYALYIKKTGQYYAATDTPMVNRKRGKTLLMHRVVLGLQPGDPRKGDHIEPSKTLFNVRSNLRIATHRQNTCNQRLDPKSKSGYKGVYMNPSTGKWTARITVNGKTHYLCASNDPKVCHEAYCKAARENFGEFARFQ